MLAPSPASSLNHILRPGGIPFIDSSCSDTALEATRYLNMDHLKEHKKEALRALAA
jgi:hypothetical protein